MRYFSCSTGTNGLKIPPKGKPGVGTADLQLRNLHGITGLNMSNSRKIEARLLLVQSVELLDLTEEPHEFDAIGTLEETGNAERLQETQEGSPDSQGHWKSWLESYLDENYRNPDLSFGDLMRKLRFSRSYGCRLFQQHFGKSFLEKLREIRIAQAVQFYHRNTNVYEGNRGRLWVPFLYTTSRSIQTHSWHFTGRIPKAIFQEGRGQRVSSEYRLRNKRRLT